MANYYINPILKGGEYYVFIDEFEAVTNQKWDTLKKSVRSTRLNMYQEAITLDDAIKYLKKKGKTNLINYLIEKKGTLGIIRPAK